MSWDPVFLQVVALVNALLKVDVHADNLLNL